MLVYAILVSVVWLLLFIIFAVWGLLTYVPSKIIEATQRDEEVQLENNSATVV